jgi:Mg2+-importing ATPase
MRGHFFLDKEVTMGFFATLISTPTRLTGAVHGNGTGTSKQLIESANKELSAVFEQLNTTPNGLTDAEVESRLETYGPNEVAREKRITWYRRLWDNFKNPLVILLVALGIISYLTGDLRATIMILLMVVLGVVLRYFQEQLIMRQKNSRRWSAPRQRW